MARAYYLDPRVDRKWLVYALLDPRTCLVRYVGVTDNPVARRIDHGGPNHGLPEKRAWLRGLRAVGLKPLFKVLEVRSGYRIDAYAREKAWTIAAMRLGRELLNAEAFRPLYRKAAGL